MKNLKRKLVMLLTVVLVVSNMQPLLVSATEGTDETVCEHAECAYTQNEVGEEGTFTHTTTCSSCGATVSTDDCVKGEDGKCVCGREYNEAPTTPDEPTETGETTEGCKHENLVYESNDDWTHKVVCHDCEAVLNEAEDCEEADGEDEDEAFTCCVCGWECPPELLYGSEGEGGVAPYSLQDIKREKLEVDLTGLTPVQLTRVPIRKLLGDTNLEGVDKVAINSEPYDSYADDYIVCDVNGFVNLGLCDTSRGECEIEIIDSEDQTDRDATRYMISASVTDSSNWLVPTVAVEEDGVRTVASIKSASYDDYHYSYPKRSMSISADFYDRKLNQEVYISFAIGEGYASVPTMKVFDGSYSNAEEAMAATEVTDLFFCEDMSQVGAGYKTSNYLWLKEQSKFFTMVSFDENGAPTGCLPFQISLNGVHESTAASAADKIDVGWLFKNVGDAEIMVQSNSPDIVTVNEGKKEYTHKLYEEYPVDNLYYLRLRFLVNGSYNKVDNSKVTAAYVGDFASIAEAQASGTTDIKTQLFGKEGFASNYSEGVTFTIFVGEDGDGQERYVQMHKTEKGIAFRNSGADVTFTGLYGADGKAIKCYIVQEKDDSYAGHSYPIIMVDNDVDLSNLKPVFRTSSGVRLYAGATPNTNTVQVSGESSQNFVNGPVQYTTASEDGSNQKNCWLTVLKTDNVANMSGMQYSLYTNSLADAEANTRVENGVVYSKREVVMYGGHDIFLTNMGTEVIPSLSASLSEDSNVQIDEYWTLNGSHNLEGYAGTVGETAESYHELPNIAKIRLKKKDDVEVGSEVKGTLTIKSAGKEIMVLELTGITGQPKILTDSIPQSVKYVPYGVMLQNSNKYSKNKVKYALYSGSLPEGVQIYENGEIYGVPKEVGKFSFVVQMTCSMYSGSDYERYVLEVIDNTDENVDSATDDGYTISQRIPDLAFDATGEHTFVSEGVLAEFKKVFLDGVELTEDQYDAVSGSTRLTINSQTLTSSQQEGRHTLGVEFRTSDATLMRAAQNFYLSADGKAPESKPESEPESKPESEPESKPDSQPSLGSDSSTSSSSDDDGASDAGSETTVVTPAKAESSTVNISGAQISGWVAIAAAIPNLSIEQMKKVNGNNESLLHVDLSNSIKLVPATVISAVDNAKIGGLHIFIGGGSAVTFFTSSDLSKYVLTNFEHVDTVTKKSKTIDFKYKQSIGATVVLHTVVSAKSSPVSIYKYDKDGKKVLIGTTASNERGQLCFNITETAKYVLEY